MNLIPLIDGDLQVWRALTTKENIAWTDCVADIDEFIARIEELFENKSKIFLTGKGNFRYERATIKPYKGNRPSFKPRFFNDLRDYMVDFKGAIVVNGFECDDALATLHAPGRTIVVSHDKDLLQLPGHIYNTYHNTIVEQDEDTAWFNFYCQMLIGDSSDNVPGINRIGKAKAPPLLEGLTIEQMKEKVLGLYNKQYGEKGQEAFDEVYDLLYLKRDVPKELLER